MLTLQPQNQLSTWGKYPFGITRVVPCVDNLYQLRDELEKRGEELFVDQESKVRLEVLHRGILWTPPVQDLQVASSGMRIVIIRWVTNNSDVDRLVNSRQTTHL